MSLRGHVHTVAGDPATCDEYGYRLGRPDGILVLHYRFSEPVDFSERRQDLLHQLYWAPTGMLAARHGNQTEFIGPAEVFWAHRAVTHEVRADGGVLFRVFLREIPAGLVGLAAGAAALTPEAAGLIQRLAGHSCDEAEAAHARVRIMAGLTASAGTGGLGAGGGYAAAVARALTRDPADATSLGEWADRLHVSAKTLQRDFEREYGMAYTRWRTMLRLKASRVLLDRHPVTEVAHLVGYASPSAFVAAFAREYGCTPGRHAGRRVS
ncbi:helix-turn-helix transcriptional regulator [Actinoplanes sp. NPDC024001]|uniref:helix-turn-helix transcriptional regulator n=1 Tax=Actinoplanes sp. NPDC024001 TaxID=3154598 RepID=UPI00340EFAFE